MWIGHAARAAARSSAAAFLQLGLTRKGPLTDEAKSEIVSVLVDQQKRLAAWLQRLRGCYIHDPDMYDDFMSAVVEAGFQVVRISYFPLDWPEGVRAEEVRNIGEELHLVRFTDEMNRNNGREGIVALVDGNEVRLRNLLEMLPTRGER